MPFSHIIWYQKRVTDHFETTALHIPKLPLTLRSQWYPIWPTITRESQISLILIYGQLFSSYRSFWDKYKCTPNDPKMILNTKRSKVPHIDTATTLSPKLHSVCSTASHFWVTGHFKTSALNDHKMTLNTKRSKVYHIYF